MEDYIKRVQIGNKHNTASMVNDTKTQLLKLALKKEPHPWHGRPIGTIRTSEIIAQLELLRDGDAEEGLRPRPYLANRTFGALRAFFTWASKTGIDKVATNPMLGVDKPWSGAKRRTRPWFAGEEADKAIVKFWKAADTLGGPEGKFLKLLILTGKRKTAIAEMRWEHIDRSWFWSPPDPGKNKRLHPVPLSILAQRVIKPRPEPGQGWVLTGTDNGRLYVNGGWLQDKIIKASGIATFIHHGVRHMVETKLAELKVLPHIRDLLLDHAPARGSGAGYDHHLYRAEMLEALELWAAHVERLVGHEAVNVTLLK